MASNEETQNSSNNNINNNCINHENSTADIPTPPMPWFGMDVGGTLVKLVYFEPTDTPVQSASTSVPVDPDDEKALVRNIHHYLTKNRAYGKHGHRDDHLEMKNVRIDGRIGNLHFIRFPTDQMPNFVVLCKEKGMARMSSTVCATGGGAYKFADTIERELRMSLHKFDELNSLIRGVDYVEKSSRTMSSSELFYYQQPDGIKTPYGENLEFPFLLVNIGSGVSILIVRGPDDYKRVSGTSLGGGTFLGLCCLLTDCQTFEEAMELAAKGDNKNVDKLVRDIYGGDYGKFGLSGEIVASSFGHMSNSEKRKNAKPEDLARATLVTLTNNIGSLVKLCAQAEKVERVLFVGNFLRINSISMEMLASSMHYWSSGLLKALFCEHEGYFGAVGCLLELMNTAPEKRQISPVRMN